MIAMTTDCDKAVAMLPAGNSKFGARFEIDSKKRVILDISPLGRNGPSRRREIPWLNKTDHPLAATLARDKAFALGIIIDNMLLELYAVEPSQAPSIETEGARKGDAQMSNATSSSDESFWAADISAGIEYFTEDALAPHLEAGVTWGKGGFFIPLRFVLGLDSSFELAGRPFDTLQVGARIGAGYLLVDARGHHLGGEVLLSWRLNNFKRADLDDSQTKHWNDLGVGLSLLGRLRLVGFLGIFLRVGVHIYPTARMVRIIDGPKERVNLVALPVTAGFDAVFFKKNGNP
jgi:hypothetical protein